MMRMRVRRGMAFLALSLLFLLSSSAEAQPFDICYVCFDGGASSVTLPDTVVPVPTELQPYVVPTQTTCAEIERVAEIEQLIPPLVCPAILDRNDLRLACGCANAVPTSAPLAGGAAPSIGMNNETASSPVAPSVAPVTAAPHNDRTCPFVEQPDRCPRNMLLLLRNDASSSSMPCNCYNFCNGNFVGCCSYQEESSQQTISNPCDFDCILDGTSEGRVTGCRDTDTPPADTDLASLPSAATTTPRRTAAGLLLVVGGPLLFLWPRAAATTPLSEDDASVDVTSCVLGSWTTFFLNPSGASWELLLLLVVEQR